MNNEYIKRFIIESEIVSLEDLKKVENYIFEKNVSFLDALLELGFLSQEILSKISANIMGVPRIDLGKKVISLDNFKMIPEPISQKHNLICFFSEENCLHIAFSEMKSLDILDKIFPQEDIKIKFFLADQDDIIEKKKKYSYLISEELSFKNKNSLKKISKIEDWGINSEKDLPDNFKNDIANDLYTSKFVSSLLEYAVNSKADFIFFNISEKNISISLRIFDRNYNLMEIERNILISILLKLKYLSDINIFEKFTIKQSSFIQNIFNQDYNIFLTFVQTDFGESVTIQLDKDKKFKTEVHSLVKKQRESLLFSQKKDSGFLIFSGDGEVEKKKSLYSFLEFDVEKNKEIYLLEKDILGPIDYTKQIEVKSSKDILSILSNIFKNFPDVIFLDRISLGIFPMIFNYVSTSKKIFFSNDMEVGKFLDIVLENDFDKGQIVKNFSLFIEHRSFKKLDSQNIKKYFLKDDEVKILKNFFSKEEILETLKEEGLEKNLGNNLSKVVFYTEIEKSKKKFLASKQGIKNHKQEDVSVRGISDLGIFLENSFLKRYQREKIKNSFRKQVKKSILENSLLSCCRGEIDIKDIIKYLTK